MSSPSQVRTVKRENWPINAREGIIDIQHPQELRCTECCACCVEVVVEVLPCYWCKCDSGRGAGHGDTVLQCLSKQFAAKSDASLTISLETVLSEEPIVDFVGSNCITLLDGVGLWNDCA